MNKKGRDANDSNAANQMMYSFLYSILNANCTLRTQKYSMKLSRFSVGQTLSKNILNPLSVLLAHHSQFEVP